MNNNELIYFDNNATTKVDEFVLEEMLPYFCEQYGNPSSMHSFGGNVGRKLKLARERVTDLIGAKDPGEITFTSCGTEGSNLALRGVLNSNSGKKHIITTKVEHPCVLNTVKFLEKKGHKVTYLNVNSDGEIDIDEFEETLTEDTAIVAVMWANNETGVIFPVGKIADITKAKNPRTKVFVDAVQAVGKIPVNVQNTNIDILSISGHKIHAPKGVGAVYIRKGTLVNPLIIGGHQEKGRRAGTENVASIIGLGKACEIAGNYLDDELTRVRSLRNKLEKGIIKNVYNARINGSRDSRVPNTTNISFEYLEGELILLHLNDLGICASSGSACTSGSLEPSHVLKAMGTPFTAMHGSIRFSLSRYSTESEVDTVIKTLPAVIEKLNSISPFQSQLNQLKDLKIVNSK